MCLCQPARYSSEPGCVGRAKSRPPVTTSSELGARMYVQFVPLRSRLAKSLVGPAGEHYVLYRLHREGMLASLAPRNAPDVDVLVINLDRGIVAAIQVKTRTVGEGWRMHKKHETIADPRLFYAFVDMEAMEPVVYIIPSGKVADLVAKSHHAWLASPGRGGRPHVDNPMRKLQDRYRHRWPGYTEGWLDEYRERWDLLRNLDGR